MSDLRPQNLAILPIEQEITNNINFESIIHDFSTMKVRRVNKINMFSYTYYVYNLFVYPKEMKLFIYKNYLMVFFFFL